MYESETDDSVLLSCCAVCGEKAFIKAFISRKIFCSFLRQFMKDYTPSSFPVPFKGQSPGDEVDHSP